MTEGNEMNRWIPFSERLPDGNSLQLRGQPTRTTGCHLADNERVQYVPYGAYIADATHWMPAPAFPEDGERPVSK